MRNTKEKNSVVFENKIRPIIVLAVSLSFFIALIACINRTPSVNKEKLEIIVYYKCSSKEASSDILFSVNEIKEQLKKKGISIKMDPTKKLCGYLLVKGIKKKTISGVLTDIDLLQEVESFY